MLEENLNATNKMCNALVLENKTLSKVIKNKSKTQKYISSRNYFKTLEMSS